MASQIHLYQRRHRLLVDAASERVDYYGGFSTAREHGVGKDKGRVDLIGFGSARILIVEGKVADPLKGIGQLHLYASHFADWPGYKLRLVLAVPTDVVTQAVRDACKHARIRVWTFKVPGLESLAEAA